MEENQLVQDPGRADYVPKGKKKKVRKLTGAENWTNEIDP
jgi:hypothetical protein